MRSRKRITKTKGQPAANAMRGLARPDIPYPAMIKGFLRSVLSVEYPERTLKKDAVDSAIPSMRPSAKCACAENAGEKNWKKGINHFAGEVCEEADKTQYEYSLGEFIHLIRLI